METKINIAELLKDSPKGMELYSPIFGEVYLDKIIPHLAIRVTTDKKQGDFKEEFLYDGRYRMNGECMLFPSKDQRDWSKFQRPFKDGDIVAVTMTPEGIWIGIFKQYEENFFEAHCSLNTIGEFYSKGLKKHSLRGLRLATEEEKQKLFEAIKANGYKWNAETKTLEKLVEPKFKVGDRIKHSRVESGNIYTVVATEGSSYTVNKNNEKHNFGIDFEVQDDWELVPNKFDITTLIPFESRVLVRDFNDEEWCPAIWGVYGYGKEYPHIVVSGNNFIQCIPYEKNEHLLGTTNDCDDYYKTWK